MNQDSRIIEARRAVEALRSGVPSAAAVRELGCGQDGLEHRFRTMLEDADDLDDTHRQAGLLVRAGFGAGKSHLLTCFERVALAEGFAASRVVISKETPLHDPAKLLAAAVENLRVDNDVGRGLDEVGLRLKSRVKSDQFSAFKLGLESDGELDSRFAATVTLFEQSRDPELEDRLLRFWAGDKLGVGEIRRPLRDLGHAASYPLAPIRARDLALQIFTFIPRLFLAAGLRGWVLLLDEVELIGRYSRLQRARSYAELARWLGGLERRPGLVTVATVTADFSAEVLHSKGDLDGIGAFMAERDSAVASAAALGMQLIEEAELLEPPDPSTLQATYDTLRRLHADAYGWDPPEVSWPDGLSSTPMRSYVRAWINAWDIRRLKPGTHWDEGGYDLQPLPSGYDEEPGLDEEGSGLVDGDGN